MKQLLGALGAAMILGAGAGDAPAQITPPSRAAVSYDQVCARCHENSLRAGSLQVQIEELDTRSRVPFAQCGQHAWVCPGLADDDLRAIAEYISERKLGIERIADAKLMPNRCATIPASTRPPARPGMDGVRTS